MAFTELPAMDGLAIIVSEEGSGPSVRAVSFAEGPFCDLLGCSEECVATV
jgi:hypothetical protein